MGKGDISFFLSSFLSFSSSFRATLMAYRCSQARGQIGATAAGLSHSHSNVGPNCIFDLHHSSWQRRILNPLSEAKDLGLNLMLPSQIHFHCTTMGTPDISFLSLCKFD